VTQNTNDLSGLPNRHSSRTALPQNNFRVPGAGNVGRYTNVELDALLDSFFVTIPKQERLEVLGRILHHLATSCRSWGSTPTRFHKQSPIGC